MTTEIIGLDTVIGNLNKEIKKIEGRTLGGLIDAVIDVRRDMDHVAPVIPVDTGNLRQSFFTVTSRGGSPKGRSPSFKGKKANEMQSQHEQTKDKYLAEIAGIKEPTVILGFSANYALEVHESYGKQFRRPDSGPGFLSAALERNRQNILQRVKEKAKV